MIASRQAKAYPTLIRVAHLFNRALSSPNHCTTKELTMATETPTQVAANPLANARLAFIGLGVMAEAIAAGLLRKGLVTPE